MKEQEKDTSYCSEWNLCSGKPNEGKAAHTPRDQNRTKSPTYMQIMGTR